MNGMVDMSKADAAQPDRPHCSNPSNCAALNPGKHCRSCVARAHNANPEILAKRRETMRERFKEPDYAERHRAATNAGHQRAKLKPGYLERKQAQARSFGAASTPAGSPARIKGGQTRSDRALAWCPPAYRAQYRDLCKNHAMRAAEAREVIMATIEADRAREARAAREAVERTDQEMRERHARDVASRY